MLMYNPMRVDSVMVSLNVKLHAARLLQADNSKSSPLLPMFKPSFGPASLPTVLGMMLLCPSQISTLTAVSSHRCRLWITPMSTIRKKMLLNALQLQPAPSGHLQGSVHPTRGHFCGLLF